MFQISEHYSSAVKICKVDVLLRNIFTVFLISVLKIVTDSRVEFVRTREVAINVP